MLERTLNSLPQLGKGHAKAVNKEVLNKINIQIRGSTRTGETYVSGQCECSCVSTTDHMNTNVRSANTRRGSRRVHSASEEASGRWLPREL